MEEQSAVTREMAGTMQAASVGIAGIATSVGSIAQASTSVDQVTRQVRETAPRHRLTRTGRPIARSSPRPVQAMFSEVRTKTAQPMFSVHADPNCLPDRLCARLQQQIALSTLMDDLVVASLASAVSAMREKGGLDVDSLEHAIRSHRVATLKQSAKLGAAGIAP